MVPSVFQCPSISLSFLVSYFPAKFGLFICSSNTTIIITVVIIQGHQEWNHTLDCYACIRFILNHLSMFCKIYPCTFHIWINNSSATNYMSILFNHNHFSWLMSHNKVFRWDYGFSFYLSLFHSFIIFALKKRKRRRQRDANTIAICTLSTRIFMIIQPNRKCTSCQMNYLSRLFAFRLQTATLCHCATAVQNKYPNSNHCETTDGCHFFFFV